MNLRVFDRLLGAHRDPRGGAAVLARYRVSRAPGRDLFLNSFAVADGAFLVPDIGNRWHLLSGDSERVEGIFPRAQALDALDASSIRAVGRSVTDLIAGGGALLDALGVSPLVPEMSRRAEMQPLELLLLDHVGHLEEVCRRPRTHLRIEIERTAVSRARRFPPQAANYLAAHTEDWERPTLRAVVPRRILAVVREDQYDIYENRVAARLVDHLSAYLSRRILEISRLLRVFDEAADHSSSAHAGSHWRRDRIYRLWGEAIGAADPRRNAERTLRQLKHLKFTVAGLMDSVLYREVPRRAAVSVTLTMTNILGNDVHYRRVADLWLAWARLGVDHTPGPREHFEDMQDLCRSFDRYALLLVLRALDQMGFEPTLLERALSDGEAELRSGERTVVLSWEAADGVITLHGKGITALRIVPLCSSIAMLEAEQLRGLVGDADAGAATNAVTLILYLPPSSADVYERLEPDVARRLHALSHEVADRGRPRAGFLPVSPWDIASVERVARQIRWVTLAPSFLAYPPKVSRSPLPELTRGATWLDDGSDGLRVVRAPHDHERIAIDPLVAAATKRVATVRAERELVSQRLAEAVRGGRATGELNARKKSLNAEVTDAEKQLEDLEIFGAELAGALVSVGNLLRCPTCNTLADPRRDFVGGRGRRFSCSCCDCSTTWGTVACSRCQAWIPTLLQSARDWTSRAKVAGWLDRGLGADVLAVPRMVGTDVGFVCPSCGEGPDG